MANYLSEDLRIRVIEAVEAGSFTSWCGGTVRRQRVECHTLG